MLVVLLFCAVWCIFLYALPFRPERHFLNFLTRLHASNTRERKKMDVLLARAHILGEKCKDTSAVQSDVCDALRGEGAIDDLSLFFFPSPPSVEMQTARD